MNLNRQSVGVILGVLVVLGLGIYGYQSYQGKKEAEGRAALYQANQVMDEEVKALSEADRNLMNAKDAGFSVDQKLSKTVTELKAILNSANRNTQTRFEAAFKLGTLYLDHGQSKAATEVFQTALNQAGTSFQKSSLFWLMGMAHEQGQAIAEANAAYLQGVQKGIDGMKGAFYLALVRTYNKLNQKDQAKLYSEKLNQEFPGTAWVTEAQELLK
jgi:tetratricopeptide (TPR) repeat protein